MNSTYVFFEQVYRAREDYAKQISVTNNNNRKKRVGSDDLLKFIKEAYPDLKSCRVGLSCLMKIFENKAIPAENDDKLKQIMKWYKAILDAIVPNVYTKQQQFTKLNNIVRKKFTELHKDAKTIFKLREDESTAKRKKQSENLMNKHKQIRLFKEEDVMSMMKDVKNGDLLDKIIACQLASGSRLIEILRISNYTPGSGPDYITVTGIAKQKGNERGNAFTVQRCLIGINSRDFIKLSNDIRSEIKDTGSNEELTNRYNSQLNKRIREYLPGSLGTHDLRRIWVNFTYPICKTDGESINYYAAVKLGHYGDNLATSLSYTTVKITNKKKNIERKTNDDVYPELNNRIVQLENKVMELSLKKKLENKVMELSLKKKSENKVIGVKYLTDLIDITAYIKMHKQPRLTDGLQLIRMLEAIEAMRKNNVRITGTILGKLGYGRRTVMEYKQIYGRL